jgi:hypothetical protein
VSFVCGYADGTFRFYFGQLQMVPEDERRVLREQLLGLGLFMEGSEYTLTTMLGKEDIELPRRVYELFLKKMDVIDGRYWGLAGRK